MAFSKYKIIAILCLAVASSACNRIPALYTDSVDTLKIYPNYDNVFVPYNIAPLNFYIETEATNYATRIIAKNGPPMLISGRSVKIGINDWKTMLNSNKGHALLVECYLKQGGKWIKYPPFKIHITAYAIDSYIVYRAIQPLYTMYEDMSINQRNLENFEVHTLIDNRIFCTDSNPHCVNCHSFQNFNKTGNMQLHVRGKNGGTLLMTNNELRKVNPKAIGLKSGAVYPSWHPSLKLIAYSTNTIGQNFHSKSSDKVEVMDSKSDLILYDVEKNEVTKITDSNDCLESFPYWSPDGNFLYYVSAKFKPKQDSIETEIESEMIANYQSIKYSIVRKPFDKSSRTFGKADTVFNAAALGKSASFPRISPDGNYLLFTMAEFGNFHIWHKSSDLCLLNLNSGKLVDVSNINSKDVESYHSWSSNGRFILFSSRREDGSYTRLYISYFDSNGKTHKPYVLPQKNPLFNKMYFRSFNIPEFIVKPVKTNRLKLYKTGIKSRI